jgi:hypothetical protein
MRVVNVIANPGSEAGVKQSRSEAMDRYGAESGLAMTLRLVYRAAA